MWFAAVEMPEEADQINYLIKPFTVQGVCSHGSNGDVSASRPYCTRFVLILLQVCSVAEESWNWLVVHSKEILQCEQEKEKKRHENRTSADPQPNVQPQKWHIYMIKKSDKPVKESTSVKIDHDGVTPILLRTNLVGTFLFIANSKFKCTPFFQTPHFFKWVHDKLEAYFINLEGSRCGSTTSLSLLTKEVDFLTGFVWFFNDALIHIVTFVVKRSVESQRLSCLHVSSCPCLFRAAEFLCSGESSVWLAEASHSYASVHVEKYNTIQQVKLCLMSPSTMEPIMSNLSPIPTFFYISKA